jgi:4-hydroxybutyrate CoA-transferase
MIFSDVPNYPLKINFVTKANFIGLTKEYIDMTQWYDIADAVSIVKSGDRIFVQGMCLTPTPLIEALVARGDSLRDVEITHLHTYGPAPYTDEKWKGHFHHRALFVGENLRKAVNEGRASYSPLFLNDIPVLFERDGILPIDVAFIHVSPPDEHGYCSLGTSVDVTRAAVDNAKSIVALVNPAVPRTMGNSFIHISRITRPVRWDGPLYEVPRRVPEPVHRLIGHNVASMIKDGATLQLGIGAIPDAVLEQLSDRKDLGIHTEMFSDGVLDLVEKGVVTGERKTIDRGLIIAAFIIGTRRLLDFVHNNPMVSMRPTNYTNDPRIIRQHNHMVAINSAVEVDLTGQVCAESIGTHFLSGVGGQMDFMRGAALSPNGRPIIALPATASAKHASDNNPYVLTPREGKVSRIVPVLTPGAVVTTSRAQVHYVVTEYGIAELHGFDISERARRLIEIAAPEFREDLERAAYQLRLLRP